jgi:hypothetical protein
MNWLLMRETRHSHTGHVMFEIDDPDERRATFLKCRSIFTSSVATFLKIQYS